MIPSRSAGGRGPAKRCRVMASRRATVGEIVLSVRIGRPSYAADEAERGLTGALSPGCSRFAVSSREDWAPEVGVPVPRHCHIPGGFRGEYRLIGGEQVRIHSFLEGHQEHGPGTAV